MAGGLEVARGVTVLCLVAAAHVAACQTPPERRPGIAELEAFGRANPGVLNFGSSGAGSFTHLQALKLTVDSGFTAVHVPVKGASQAMTEVMAGRLDFYTPGAVAAIPMIAVFFAFQRHFIEGIRIGGVKG